MILAQASLAPCFAEALGRTKVTGDAAIRLCPGNHCLTVRFVSSGTEIHVYESKNGWLRLSRYKSTGVPNLKVAEWIRRSDTLATAKQIATWAKNENVNLLAKSEREKKERTAKKAVRKRDAKRHRKKVRRRRARRRKVASKPPSMDKIYSQHLIVSGECESMVESGKSEIFKGYFYFLCDNDLFYRLLTSEQIWVELRQSKMTK